MSIDDDNDDELPATTEEYKGKEKSKNIGRRKQKKKKKKRHKFGAAVVNMTGRRSCRSARLVLAKYKKKKGRRRHTRVFRVERARRIIIMDSKLIGRAPHTEDKK